MRKTWGIPD